MKSSVTEFWSWLTGSPSYVRSSERLDALMAQIEQHSAGGAELVGYMRDAVRDGKTTLGFTTPKELRDDPNWKDDNARIHVEGEPHPGFANDPEFPLLVVKPTCTPITFKHTLKDEELTCAFIHEARHCFQVWEDPFPLGSTKESLLYRSFAIEADAEAHVCRITYEMAQKGVSGPWQVFRAHPLREDIARVYEQALPQGAQAALEAAHFQWEQSPLRVDIYTKQLESLLALQNSVTYTHANREQTTDLTHELRERFEVRVVQISLPQTQERDLGPELVREPKHEPDFGYGY